jgi:hypothetical protein
MNPYDMAPYSAFKRNKIYATEPDDYGVDVVKYYTTLWSEKYSAPVGHYFGHFQSPDWDGSGAVPEDASFYRDAYLEYDRNYVRKIIPMKKYHAKRAAEVGIMTGTKAEGPVTQEGKPPRTQAPVILPRDVTRHIAEFAGQGRRRKTRRARRS